MTWPDLHRYTHLWHVFELDIHKRPSMVGYCLIPDGCTETSSLWAGGISRCDWCDWLKGHGWGLVKIHAPPSRVASTKVWWFSYSGGRCYPPGSQHVPMQFWRFEDGFLFAPWEDTSRTAYPVRFHRESIHFQPFSVKAMLAWCAGMFFLPPRVFRGAFSL